MDKHVLWAFVIKNSITLICFTILAIIFGKWWIIFFSALFLSYIKGTKTHMVCDGCGRYSPDAKDHQTAIEEEFKAGWVRIKKGDKWEDYCPDCQTSTRM